MLSGKLRKPSRGWGAIFLALIVGFLFSALWWTREPEPISVAVLGFENRTERPDDAFGVVVREMVDDALASHPKPVTVLNGALVLLIVLTISRFIAATITVLEVRKTGPGGRGKRARLVVA